MKYYQLNIVFNLEHMHDAGDTKQLGYVSKTIYTSKNRAEDAMPKWEAKVEAISKKYLIGKPYVIKSRCKEIGMLTTDAPRSTYLTSMFKRRQHRARAIKRGAKCP